MQQSKYILLVFLFHFALPAFLFAQKDFVIIDTAELNQKPDSVFYTIGSIEISGNKHTKNYIVFREIAFKSGDVFAPHILTEKLTLTKNQLVNTALFNDVNVYVSSLQNNIANIKVEMKERWYIFPLPYFKLVDRNFNQWWYDQNKDLSRVNYGIKFFYDNLSGRRDKLSVDLVNGYNQQIILSYSQPFSDKSLKHGFAVGMFYNRQREVNYTTTNNKQTFLTLKDFVRESKGISARYSYQPDSKSRLLVNIGVNNENVLDTVVKLNPLYYGYGKNNITYFFAAIGYKYFNVDYIPFPQKGFMYEISLYNRGFSKQMNLFALTVETTNAIKFTKNNFIQFHNLGMLRAKDQQPYINQGMFGYGDVFVRGLESYVIDGTAGFLSNTTAYQKLFKYVFKNPIKVKNHERIPFTFYLKAFGDMGYVYNNMLTANSLSNKFLYSGGIGLDIVSMYDFVFRLEYRINQFNNQSFGGRVRGDF